MKTKPKNKQTKPLATDKQRIAQLEASHLKLARRIAKVEQDITLKKFREAYKETHSAQERFASKTQSSGVSKH
jgi:hypothetical protein